MKASQNRMSLLASPFARLSKRGIGAAAAALLLLSLVGVMVSPASAWKECSVSPEDAWREASPTEPTLAWQMRSEYERRYTCSNEAASFVAAEYYFDSPCLEKRFRSFADVQTCLEGRRVIFLGDSLSNQQGDSLVGMLGWHPGWLPLGGPRNAKQAVDDDGNKHFTMADCWYPGDDDMIRGVERCFDLYESEFMPPAAEEDEEEDAMEVGEPSINGRASADGAFAVQTETENGDSEPPAEGEPEEQKHHRHTRQRGLRPLRWPGGEEGEGDGDRVEESDGTEGGEGGEEEEEEEEYGTSVHMRMMSTPQHENWFTHAVEDYNGTRPGDVFVVNFGAHYHETPEGDVKFRNDVFSILEEMAIFGEEEDVTVVWREIAPTHFPGANGSYGPFLEEGFGQDVCCTGTPPKQLERNLWVEEYIEDFGLADRVKLLKVYDMSIPRGAAHHTCNLAPPSTMDQAGAESDFCHSGAIDCRHWSETGVVEEWNSLLLNHIC